MSLRIIPIFQKEAMAYIEQYHRHHKKPQGLIFCVACADGDKVVVVAIVGRPHDRHNQDGFTACVTRLCTDGTKNACSMLYGACWRIAREMGYRKLMTYILKSEPGTSLKAAGWKLIGERGSAKGWSVPSRPRVDTAPQQMKLLYQVEL